MSGLIPTLIGGGGGDGFAARAGSSGGSFLPLLLGGLAGMFAGRKLAPKPSGQSTTTGTTAPTAPTAPATPALPPSTTANASTNTAAANAAAIKQRRRARGTPPLTTPGTVLGSPTAKTTPLTLLGQGARVY